jgi:hypothetical protein
MAFNPVTVGIAGHRLSDTMRPAPERILRLKLVMSPNDALADLLAKSLDVRYGGESGHSQGVNAVYQFTP